jgi:hypothetical protein
MNPSVEADLMAFRHDPSLFVGMQESRYSRNIERPGNSIFPE